MIESAADRLALLQVAGEEIEIDDVSIWAIFDDENSPITVGDMRFQATAPQVICQTSDVADVSQDSTIRVRSTFYRLADLQPEVDGGLTTLRLRRL